MNTWIIKTILNKVYIHPLTYFILFISFLASYFEIMYLLLLIILVHELGHLLFISIMGYNVSKITIYPFGGLTEYSSNINESIIKEVIICISGPIIQLLFMILVMNLKDYTYLNTYNNFIKINIILFKFNLLPIIPLDGGRLLNLLLDYILPYKYSLYISNIISVLLCIIFIVYFTINIEVFISILFILTLINSIKEYRSIKLKYNKFLLERILHNYNYKHSKVINDYNKLKRNKYNYIKKDNIVYDENIYLKKYVFNSI